MFYKENKFIALSLRKMHIFDIDSKQKIFYKKFIEPFFFASDLFLNNIVMNMKKTSIFSIIENKFINNFFLPYQNISIVKIISKKNVLFVFYTTSNSNRFIIKTLKNKYMKNNNEGNLFFKNLYNNRFI